MKGRYKNIIRKGLAVIIAAAILCQGVSAEETPDNSLGKEAIEEALDLANISPEWTYSEENDAWRNCRIIRACPSVYPVLMSLVWIRMEMEQQMKQAALQKEIW